MNIDEIKITFDFTSIYGINTDKNVALFKIPLRIKISPTKYTDICQIGLDRKQFFVYEDYQTHEIYAYIYL